MTINWIIWTVTHLHSYKIKKKRTNTKNYNFKNIFWKNKNGKDLKLYFESSYYILWKWTLLSKLPGKLLENNLLHTKICMVKLSELKRQKKKKLGEGASIYNDQII